MKMKRALSWVLLVAMLVSMFGTGVVATDTVEAPQETPAVVEPIAEPVVSPEPQSEPAPVVEETPAETSEETEILTTPAETPEETPEATQTPEETPAEAPAASETPTETGEETTEEQPVAEEPAQEEPATEEPAVEEPATEEPAAEENATETVELLPEESTEEDADLLGPPRPGNYEEGHYYHIDIVTKGNYSYKFNYYGEAVTDAYLKITKTWDDQNDADGIRPDSVTVPVYQVINSVSTFYTNVTLTAADSWTTTLVVPIVDANGKDIQYTVDKDDVTGYDCSLTDNTNYDSFIKGSTTVYTNGTNSITFGFGDNAPYVSTGSLTITANDFGSDNTYSGRITSNNIDYDYTWTYDPATKTYSYTSDEIMDVTSLTSVTYTSCDYTDSAGNPRVIQLYPGYNYTVDSDSNREEGTYNQEFFSANRSITDMDGSTTIVVGYRYTMTYVNQFGVLTTVSDSTSQRFDNPAVDNVCGKKNAGTDEAGYDVVLSLADTVTEESYADSMPSFDFALTNKHSVEKVNVTVNKTWNHGNNPEDMRPTEIYYHLLADGVHLGTDYRVKATAESNWGASWENLPKYRYDTEGNQIAIIYTVWEEPIYGKAGSGLESIIIYDVTYDKDETTNTITVTNTYGPDTTQFAVIKQWDDAENQDGIRPSSVDVQLQYRLGSGEWTDYQNGKVTLSASNASGIGSWSYYWTKLPAYTYDNAGEITGTYEYRVIELTSVGGYNEEAGQPTITQDESVAYLWHITNYHTPATTSITVDKVWSDNHTNSRPASIAVNLLADGVVVDTISITPENGVWPSHTFTDLPVYDDGKEIKYSVEEVAVPNYTASYSELSNGKITITNTLQTVDVSVTKEWDDNDAANKRPKSITLRLYGNGQDLSAYYASEYPNASNPYVVTLMPDNNGNWPRYIWRGLAASYNGVAVEYTVWEDAIVDSNNAVLYKPSYEKNGNEITITNTYDPDHTEIAVVKVWDDNYNQDGVRPATIQAQLLYKKTGDDWKEYNPSTDGRATLSATSTPAWSHVWTGLPLKIDGVEVEYAVKEILDATAAANYTPIVYTNADGSQYTENSSGIFTETTDGYIIHMANKHTPATTEISVTKKWDDKGNTIDHSDDIVTVELLADGVPTGKTVELKNDAWTATFTDLAKYKNVNGTVMEIKYTVAEKAVTGYTASYSALTDGAITITNTLETTQLYVRKVWDDDSDHDRIRPDFIDVTLLADGEEVSTVQVGTSNWHAFTNLPKYNSDGSEIEYTVTEKSIPEGYELTSTTHSGSIWTLTNTHELETIDLKVIKNWDDDNNRDGIRPDSLSLRLYADAVLVYGDDGEPLEAVMTADANGNWVYTFVGLLKYDSNGVDVNYEVRETRPDGYTLSAYYHDYNTHTISITNTHVPDVTTVSGTKYWVDNNDQDGIRPAQVTIELYADVTDDGNQNGTKVHEQHASASNNWSWSFTNLPVNENVDGKIVEIDYYVKEISVPGYTTVYGDHIITNTHVPYTIDIVGEKVWEDKNDEHNNRPESVVIELYGRNDALIDTAVVSAATDWKFQFTDLPVYYNGTLIDYYILEKEANDDDLVMYSVQISSEWQEDTEEKDYNKVYTVTNTYTNDVVTVAGSKTWIDNNNQDGKRPASITINLFADGVKYDSKEVTADDNWSGSWENLPRYVNNEEVVYTIGEEPVPGYTTAVHGYNIVNTHIPETITITGEKTWDDGDDQDGIRPHNIEITLMKKVGTAEPVEVASEWISGDGDNWKWSFADLPRYEGGVEIQYYLLEKEIDGYDTTITDINEDGVIDITNTHKPAVITISGKKTWDDSNDQDGKRPESITINLMANGEKVDSKTVTEKDGWKWAFVDVAKYENGDEILYTISEDAVDGYKTVVDGYNVTNTHETEKLNIPVQKVWNDDDDRDAIRPESVTVKLYADGKDTGMTLVLSDENEWAGTFYGMDVNKAGKAVIYTVVETDVEGYTPVVTGSVADGLTITNTHEIETTEITVKKLWKDNDDADGIRPESVKIQLLAGGEKVGEAVEVKDTYTWTDLPVNEDGEAIVYTVEEIDTPKGYEPKYSDLKAGVITITNVHEQETTDIKVTKTWVDNNDAKKARPKNITVQLYANGVEYGAAVTITSDMKWEYTFEDLPANKGGEPIKYTVKEAGVKHYVAKYTVGNNNVLVIKNTYTDIPLTGDTINMLLWSIIGGSAMLSLGGVTVIAKRKKFVK